MINFSPSSRAGGGGVCLHSAQFSGTQLVEGGGSLCTFEKYVYDFIIGILSFQFLPDAMFIDGATKKYCKNTLYV